MSRRQKDFDEERAPDATIDDLRARRAKLIADAKERDAQRAAEAEENALRQEVARLEREAIVDLGGGTLRAGADLNAADTSALPKEWKDPARYYYWARVPRVDEQALEAGTVAFLSQQGYRPEAAPRINGAPHPYEQAGHALMSCPIEEKRARDAVAARRTDAEQNTTMRDRALSAGMPADVALVTSQGR